MGGAAGSAGAAGSDDCPTCRELNCTDWQGFSGWDVFHGCLDISPVDLGHGARTVFGADLLPDEMTFVQQCIDVLARSATTNCAYGRAAMIEGGVAPCYCGSRNATDCLSMGPATDADTAACRAEWEAATRQTSTSAVFGVSGDSTLPAGWAFELLSCSRLHCGSACDNVP